jgi:hypothetical protein
MRISDFKAGWLVVANDGRRVGTVKGVMQNYFVTSRPGFAADLYVPASFIANVEHETIHLNIAHAEAEQMGWEQAPRDDGPADEPGSDLHRHV